MTSKVRLEVLGKYLKGTYDWDSSVLECMNLLDHILRQGPSETHKLIKRTLFNVKGEQVRLGQFVEAVKGVYSAFRMTESVNSGGLGLGVNVDVSNQSFWIGQKMDQLVRNFLASMNRQWANLQIPDLVKALRPVNQGGQWVQSEAFKALKRLARLKFATTHNQDDQREYTIFRFAFRKELGAEGVNAKSAKFMRKLNNGAEKETSIYDYYLERYNCKIMNWQLPMIETGKGGLFPLETCEIRRLNPYPFKLDPGQTQEMIKFAVQRPPQRKQDIMRSVALLDWNNDKYLKAFGLKISSDMPMVNARLIPNPKVGFAGNKSLDPRMAGRWDLRGYQFAIPNPAPLKSWAFVIVDRCLDVATATNFAKVFATTYKSHGGKIVGEPAIMEHPSGMTYKSLVSGAYNYVGQKFKLNPQILFFIMKGKDTGPYETLKRCADVSTGIATQMLQASHARKAAPQYCSNLAMKVNAKLGGQTSKAIGPAPFTVPTCMLGVDVSHASPGIEKASIASMCLSMDRDTAVYQGRVETNGWRVEILEPRAIEKMLTPMVKSWIAINKRAPEHLFYFRDGVSAGQFTHVLDFEVKEIKKIFQQETGKVPKMAVIIATKRHHIRFFPEKGDKNGNPMPGTLVEREVTHPFQYDFYLCSHVAIQGTARPVHYTVICDDIGMKPDDLQKMIYHQCYQYCRSTTPVSLHPAVYYAHLAGNRGRPHEADPRTATESKAGGKTVTSKDKPAPADVVPLASDGRNNETKIAFERCMWYV